MSALLRSLRGRRGARSWPSISLDEFANYFTFNGLQYPLTPSSTLTQEREEPPTDFQSYVEQLYRSNGVVFACMAVRQRIFSEARFQFQRRPSGRPSNDLFGSPILAPLERPWGPSSTSGDLLTRMIQDVDLAGNAFIGRLPGNRLTHMRPDWVTIVVGSKRSTSNPNFQLDAEVAGYLYYPGGKGGGEDPELLLPENVAHFLDTPDPTARFRGMSWLTPVVREVMGDSASTQHKLMFFEQGATPNLVVTLGEQVNPDNFQKFVELFEEQQEGVLNAYKTLFFGGGASVEVVGANLRQLDFKVTQQQGEQRIAAAAGVPNIIAGLGADPTYLNWGMARRAFGDMTIRPLWRKACGSLETVIDMAQLQGGTPAALWYDDRHIPFLQEDVKDDAIVMQMQASTAAALITAGWKADDAIKAVAAGDISELVGSHSGLVSVQLFEPGKGPSTVAPGASPESNGKPPALPAPA